MVKKEVIRKRLNKLDEYLSILEECKKYSFQEFNSKPEIYGSVERFLHLFIEAIIDIGNHIISDLNWGVTNWYSDIPITFFEKKLIDEELREKWIKIIGFRNTLVHDYVEIDRKIVFDVLHKNLIDLNELKRVFAKFL